MNPRLWSRNRFLRASGALVGAGGLAGLGCAAWKRGPRWRVGVFECDVTPPLGHPLMGGGIAPASGVSDRLHARGIVFSGEEPPVVVLSVEWCEIRNDAYDQWREAIAKAVGTMPERVILSCVHVHDAPVADLTAERMLREAGAAGSICDPLFHEQAVQRVAAMARTARSSATPVTHVGIGTATVEKIASNRRYLLPDGSPSYDRMSSTRNPLARDADVGAIDPRLKTLSFWADNRALAALHVYATHPMSYYGSGRISADFVGMARQQMQREHPECLAIYASGCSGNVTAGKWNDGSTANRPLLAERLGRAMRESWSATRRIPFGDLQFRNVPLRLEVRSDAGFSEAELRARVGGDPRAFGQCLAALGLSWRKRCEQDRAIDVPVLGFGSANLILLPAEAYVEYQLFAEGLHRDVFTMVLGYGECAPGYIPIERAWAEGDSNLRDWCWVAPGSEERMRAVIRRALGP